MPKLLFTPKEHKIGDNQDIFITACKNGENALCIKCNEVAAFIIRQMHPQHKPRLEIIPLVVSEFGCTYAEAAQAVNTVINKLLEKGAE
ncbi:MAG: hypothetical protein ACOYJS_02630 [Acutalibacteraceae bacterium]|jgi:hypothetical protein